MKRKHKISLNIRGKLTLIVWSAVLITMVVGMGMGYYLGYNLLHKTIEGKHIKLASLLSTAISERIDNKIKEAYISVVDPVWIKKIKESNLIHESMESNERQNYLLDLDKKWRKASGDDPLLKEFLDNEISNELKVLLRQDNDIGEIFLTNKFGGIIALTGKTSDFYQADEEWWQEAYNYGKGKTFIGDIEFDESADIFCIAIAVPVRDYSDEVVGIGKFVIKLNFFLELLKDFKIGKTGHAVLVDQENNIIYHEELKTVGTKFLSEQIHEELKQSKLKTIITLLLYAHQEEMFIACAEVDYPLLQEGGVGWRIFIVQSAAEVFAPLKRLAIQSIGVFLVLIVLAVFLGLVYGQVFSGPIAEIHKATEQISKGDLEYKVVVKSSDELGQLAEAFNDMVEKLKLTTASRDELNKEIQEREKIERELRESEKMLAEAQRIVHIGSWELDLIKNKFKWSDEIYRIFGLEPQEFNATYEIFLDMVHPDDRKFVDETYRNSVEQGSPCNIIHRIVRPDGEVRDVHEKYEHCKDKTGKVTSSLGTVQDITEQREMQNKLHKLSYAIEQGPSVTVITNTQGNIEYANPSFTRLTGYTLEEVIGKSPSILESGKFSPRTYKKIWQTINSGGQWRGEFHNKKKNGELYWEFAAFSAIKDERGRITHFIKVAEDITPRKKLEEEAKKQLHELEVFYRASIGRESRILELKEEVRFLKKELEKKKS